MTGDPPTAGAEVLAKQANEAGYDLDYSPESLARLDELVDELPHDALVDYGRHISAYLGEVFVESYGGEWTLSEEIGWLVEFPAVENGNDVLVVPHAVAACLEGDATFAYVHDDTIASMEIDGPKISERGVEGPPTGGIDEDSLQKYQTVANEFVENFVEYDLDFTPSSFERLDELIATHYDMSPEDVDREHLARESKPGTVPASASLTIGSGGAAEAIAAYFGEVYRREYDAEWRESGAFDALVIETSEGTVELEPEMLVTAAFSGHVLFARLHRALVSEAGLSAPGN